MSTINEAEELLSNLKRVDAPPFLYTRILARISAPERQYVKPVLAVATALSFIALLALNVYAISGSSAQPQQVNLLESFHLMDSQSLY